MRPEYVGVTQAAQICNCKPSTIYNRISRGKFVQHIERDETGVYRFRREEVEEFARTYIKHPKRTLPCPPHLITAAEICQLLGCAYSNVTRLVRTGKLPPPVRGGGQRGSRMLFDRAAVVAFAEAYRKGKQQRLPHAHGLMSLAEVTRALHRTAAVVRRWVEEGEFPKPVLEQHGRTWFNRKEAEAAIARHLAEENDLITAAEAARMMGCTRQRIHQRVACGSFVDPVKRPGHAVYFRRRDVEEYIKQHPKGQVPSRAERMQTTGLIGLDEAAAMLGIPRARLYYLARTGRFVKPVRREVWGYAYDPEEVARYAEEYGGHLRSRRRIRTPVPLDTGVTPAGDTVTLVEAARIIGCEPSELYRRLYRGQFVPPVQRRKHERYRFNRADVIAYRDRQAGNLVLAHSAAP